ncbi:hypothetical protein C8R45DRAFT_155258 [Mycena sanguinolenta]|nr:hypothetical protein C8R45DRAFT_155258 [Mycena sanguinolenta]
MSLLRVWLLTHPTSILRSQTHLLHPHHSRQFLQAHHQPLSRLVPPHLPSFLRPSRPSYAPRTAPARGRHRLPVRRRARRNGCMDRQRRAQRERAPTLTRWGRWGGLWRGGKTAWAWCALSCRTAPTRKSADSYGPGRVDDGLSESSGVDVGVGGATGDVDGGQDAEGKRARGRCDWGWKCGSGCREREIEGQAEGGESAEAGLDQLGESRIRRCGMRKARGVETILTAM